MKAIQYDRFGGPEVLNYVDLPEPVPGKEEFLIETGAIGVNFPDIRERLGIYNQAATRVGGVQLPQVGGLAVTGTVTAAGPGADQGLVGRPVVAAMKKGAYAQYALTRQDLTVAVDEGTDCTALAGIAGQGMTAYLALQASTVLRSGESLLVHGAAGGVGGLAVQIGKALGAHPVIGTASTPERRQHVLDSGRTPRSATTSPGGPARSWNSPGDAAPTSSSRPSAAMSSTRTSTRSPPSAGTSWSARPPGPAGAS